MIRIVAFTLFAVIVLIARAPFLIGGDAQQSNDVNLTVAAIISIQPAAFADEPSIYLGNGLSGNVPGISTNLQKRLAARVFLGFDFSTTTYFSTLQDGRFIYGDACDHNPPTDECHAVLSRGRDTIFAGLVGTGNRLLEVSGGAGALLSQTDQSGNGCTDSGAYNHGGCKSAFDFAITGGLDATVPLGRRTAFVATFRYIRAFRDDETVLYTGIGRNIYRMGVGLRLTLWQGSAH
jgi:hypothetical protein